jgi:hypothetical protein
MLFKEKIPVTLEVYETNKYKLQYLPIIKEDGIYSYRWVLKVW